MIVDDSSVDSLKYPFAMVDGCFDPLHAGHLRYFQAAKEKFGLPVFCHVQADGYIERTKKRPALLPGVLRAELINGLKPIDYVFLNNGDMSTADVLLKFKPKIYIKGSDWQVKGLPPRELEVCRLSNTEIRYMDTVSDSSTSRVNDLVAAVNQNNFRDQVAKFEAIVLNQGIIPSSSYDQSYFLGDWRKNENSYSLEKRREIEAKNPENIKAVFNPKSVLDVGCGPGALMHFLAELGIDVTGLEFSEDAKSLASELVKDRIHIGSVTKFLDLGKKFDLVICREVLEHLTVLQVRATVAAMARFTNKFLYITTRYYQNPISLLDVGDDKKTDPTHITVMNKEFIRALFVLEGMKSRPDLEARMDWRGFGRVMVFEKAVDVSTI
jgi:cytidyltransferase-like protein